MRRPAVSRSELLCDCNWVVTRLGLAGAEISKETDHLVTQMAIDWGASGYDEGSFTDHCHLLDAYYLSPCYYHSKIKVCHG